MVRLVFKNESYAIQLKGKIMKTIKILEILILAINFLRSMIEYFAYISVLNNL